MADPPVDAGFRALADLLPHIVWITSIDGTLEFLNEPGAKYVGRAARPASGHSCGSSIHPDDAARIASARQAAMLTSSELRTDARIRRFDGVFRSHDIVTTPVRDGQGAVTSWVGTAVDREAARLRPANLPTAERDEPDRLAMLEKLVADAPIGLGWVDPGFRQVLINDTLAAINGSTVQAQLGRTVAELLPDLWPQLEPVYRHVLLGGGPLAGIEVSGTTAADPLHTRHWQSALYPLAAPDGDIVGVGIAVVDVTERKLAEQQQRQLAQIVATSGEAIFASSLDGFVLTWNASAERLYGYSAQEMIGRHVAIMAPPGLVHEQEQMRRRIAAGGPSERYEARRRRKDGSLVDVQVTASPSTDETGAVIGVSVIVQDITERLASQRAVRVSERRLAEAQQIAQIGSFEHDVQTGELTWSAEHYRILGLDPGVEPHLDRFLELVHPDDRAVVADAWTQALALDIGFDLVLRIVRPDSEQRWVNIRAVVDRSEDGSIARLVGTLRDNTERMEALRTGREAQARFEIAFEKAAIGAGIVDLDGIPRRLNAAVCEFLGRSREELLDHNWDGIHHPDELPIGQAMLARGTHGDSYTDERRFLRPDGSVVWAIFHDVLVRDDNGQPQYHFAQLQDVTERKQMEAELVHQALHDALTGLPNRALLTDRLSHGLAGVRRRGAHLAVIFLDLDRFKVVNDSLGHTAGDELLIHAVERIAASIRPSDTLARFGGDEFVIVCEGSASEAMSIAQRVLAALEQPYTIAGRPMSVTTSIGVVAADELATPESLLRDSDAAMYRAKRAGRNRIELFDASLRSEAQRRLATEGALRLAIERAEFSVVYQPIVDLPTGVLVSAEALLRWDRPGHGSVSPADFVPVAEETGLIVAIGIWVLEQACLQLVDWQRSDPAMTVSVNLSVRQLLTADIVEQVADVLERTGAPPASVCLELTESVFMGDAEYFVTTLAGLKSLGVTLSIDDFGTGFASFSYLKRFAVDAVKIDKIFVDGLGTSQHDSALVAAIIAMVEALGLSVTAEGIETPQQLATLRELHCARAQGFLLARPMSADSLTELMQQAPRW